MRRLTILAAIALASCHKAPAHEFILLFEGPDKGKLGCLLDEQGLHQCKVSVLETSGGNRIIYTLEPVDGAMRVAPIGNKGDYVITSLTIPAPTIKPRL